MKKILICLAVMLNLSTIVWADGIKPAVAENIKSRMVNIFTTVVNPETKETELFYGNGVMISSNFVFTAAHLFSDKDKIYLFKSKAIVIDADCLRFFDDLDFATVDIMGFDLPKVAPVKYGSAEKLNYGQTVILGARVFYDMENYYVFLQEGQVCAISLNSFLLNFTPPRGSSGSGVYNQKGELIGMLIGAVEFGGVDYAAVYKIDAIRRMFLKKAVEKEIEEMNK